VFLPPKGLQMGLGSKLSGRGKTVKGSEICPLDSLARVQARKEKKTPPLKGERKNPVNERKAVGMSRISGGHRPWGKRRKAAKLKREVGNQKRLGGKRGKSEIVALDERTRSAGDSERGRTILGRLGMNTGNHKGNEPKSMTGKNS